MSAGIESIGQSPEDYVEENRRLHALESQNREKGFPPFTDDQRNSARSGIRQAIRDEHRRDAIRMQVARQHTEQQATPAPDQAGEPVPAVPVVDPLERERALAAETIADLSSLLHKSEDAEGKFHAARMRADSWSPGTIATDADLTLAIITRNTLHQVERGNFNHSSRAALDEREKALTSMIQTAKTKGHFSDLEPSFLNEKIAAKAERYGRPSWNHPSRTPYVEVLASEIEQTGIVGQRLVRFVNSQLGELPTTFGHAGYLLLPGAEVTRPAAPYGVSGAVYRDKDLPVIDGTAIVDTMRSIADWCRAEEALEQREREERERIAREKAERERAERRDQLRDLLQNDPAFREEFRAMLDPAPALVPTEGQQAELVAVAQET
jgi:hypothetical protein